MTENSNRPMTRDRGCFGNWLLVFGVWDVRKPVSLHHTQFYHLTESRCGEAAEKNTRCIGRGIEYHFIIIG